MRIAPTIRCLLLGVGLAQAGCDAAVAKVEPPPPKVSVRHPELRSLTDNDKYNGWLEAVESVEVRARVRGHIDKINFTDGRMVEKGQVLIELDPRPFEAEVARTQDQIKVYQAQKIAADREEARLKELQKKGGASQSQVDKAEAEAASLQAQIDATQQEIKRKLLEVDYAKVAAPISGRVGRAMLTQGNLVNAGGSDPLLTTIVSIDPIHVYFSVDERSLQRYQKYFVPPESQPAGASKISIPFKFGLETDDGYPHDGTINFRDNKVDRTTGTILVRGEVENKQGRFVPGSRVRISVPVSAERKELLVPDTAVLTDQEKKYLLVVDGKNVVQRRDVSVGRLLDDGNRVVPATADGLKADDWIITIGLQAARINYPVEPIRPTN